MASRLPNRSPHTPLMLIELVRVVSAFGAPADPLAVSQRVWDANRVAAGAPGAPPAHKICQRLGVSWPQLLRIAHGDPAGALQGLRVAQSDRGRKGISLEQVLIALRQAALRLGRQGINRSDYVTARGQMLEKTRATRHRGARRRAIPELNQIEAVLGQHGLSWSDALERAGLAEPEPVLNAGLEPAEAVREYAAHMGAVPRGVKPLLRWARTVGVRVQRHMKRVALDQAIAELQRQRALAGQSPLPLSPVDADFTVATSGPAPVGPRRHRRDWTKDKVIDGMALAIAHLRPGEHLTQRTLKRIAREHGNEAIPSWSVVDRHLRRTGETFEEWRREAERLAAAGAGEGRR